MGQVFTGGGCAGAWSRRLSYIREPENGFCCFFYTGVGWDKHHSILRAQEVCTGETVQDGKLEVRFAEVLTRNLGFHSERPRVIIASIDQHSLFERIFDQQYQKS